MTVISQTNSYSSLLFSIINYNKVKNFRHHLFQMTHKKKIIKYPVYLFNSQTPQSYYSFLKTSDIFLLLHLNFSS